jgi:hypothetical protein
VESGAATTTLFRAVTLPELESIQSLNAFSNPAGIEVKYFTTSMEEAQSYASRAAAAIRLRPDEYPDVVDHTGDVSDGRSRNTDDRGADGAVA